MRDTTLIYNFSIGPSTDSRLTPGLRFCLIRTAIML